MRKTAPEVPTEQDAIYVATNVLLNTREQNRTNYGLRKVDETAAVHGALTNYLGAHAPITPEGNTLHRMSLMVGRVMERARTIEMIEPE